MIELPETHVLASQVQETLVGKRIVRIQANTHPHKFAWYSDDPEEYHDMLTGKRIIAAAPRTGLTCGSSTVVLCDDMILAMTTPIKYHLPGSRLPAKHQLLLEFDDGSHMSCTVQMWGAMFCYPAEDSKIPADSSPSPLEDSFDKAYFEKLRSGLGQTYSVKAFLATEQRIPGIGNGVLQDILWNAKIHPKRRLFSLTDGEMENLYNSLKDTLRAMTEQGGRDTEKDLFGHPGGYKTILSKLTVSCPCTRCGSMPVRQAYLGGNIYFCPICQPENL